MAARLQLLLQAHETAGIHSAGGAYIDFGIGCGLPVRLVSIVCETLYGECREPGIRWDVAGIRSGRA
jgi:hypothetical protein